MRVGVLSFKGKHHYIIFCQNIDQIFDLISDRLPLKLSEKVHEWLSSGRYSGVMLDKIPSNILSKICLNLPELFQIIYCYTM